MDAKILPDLLVFLEVVRSGSLTLAARRLNTVQSNVTARVAKLEESLAAPLLTRHARGVRPTPAGEAAVRLAERLSSVLDDVRFTFASATSSVGSRLRIGAIETVLASHLPRVVAAFSKQHPKIDVSVNTGSSASLIQRLKDGELDAVFVSRPTLSAALRERVAFRDELVLLESLDSHAPQKPWLRAAPAFNILVQRLGCSYTERLLETIGKAPRRPYRLLELGTLEGVLRFVEAGLGVAALPKAFVSGAGFRKKVALVALPPQVRKLETFLVTPAEADAPFASNAFFKLVSSLAGGEAPGPDHGLAAASPRWVRRKSAGATPTQRLKARLSAASEP